MADTATAPIFEEKALEKVLEEADELAGDDEQAEDDAGDDKGDSHAGGASAARTKPFFNIIEVVGASVPSDNAKFSGNTPSVAARKAARRIWKRSGKRSFEIIMRRVSKTTAGRVLYKYRAQVAGRDEPIAFFAATAKAFDNVDGSTSKNAVKRIHIVRNPDAPIYGCVDSEGMIVECGKDEASEGLGVIHRIKGTNTLVLGISDEASFPKKVGKHTVVRDDHTISVTKSTISESETSEYDVAGAAKAAAKLAAKQLKQKEKDKKAKAKRATQEAERRAKETAKNKKKKSSTGARPAGKMTGGSAARAATNPGSSPASSSSGGDANARTLVRNAEGQAAKSDAVLTFSH